MSSDIKRDLRFIRNRNYLSKDFDDLRAELIEYARIFFPDRIQDFSDASLGGLLLDMAAFVGDTNSFYLDHQFRELNPDEAVEVGNIEKHAINAGIKTVSSAPSVVDETVSIEVPSTTNSVGESIPLPSSLPIVKAGTTIESNTGILFNLTEDIDFSSVDENGIPLYTREIGKTTTGGAPTSFILKRKETFVSGNESEETFEIGNFEAYREITLSNSDVTSILSVSDSDGNVYYQVDELSQDTTFKAITNKDTDDKNLVPYLLEIIPAPYRFIILPNIRTNTTTIQFGAGDGATVEDSILPEPSKVGLKLHGRKNFSRFSIDPNSLLESKTLGTGPSNTTITVRYRYGGGKNHNVAAKSIRAVSNLNLVFPITPSQSIANDVRTSISVFNDEPSIGGDNPPTMNDIKQQIRKFRNSQSRIVTVEDLISRVYSLPVEFGRVHRVTAHPNPSSPLVTDIYVISKNSNNNLSTTPDSLKKNLKKFLNEFRLVSESFDMLDCRIINFKIDFKIEVARTFSKQQVLQNVISNLKNMFNINTIQIDKPLNISDIEYTINNTQGVFTIRDLFLTSLTGMTDGRKYSDDSMHLKGRTKNKLITGEPGTIFELKFPDSDIIGFAV